MDTELHDHQVIRTLHRDLDRLRLRVQHLENVLRQDHEILIEDHEKLERLEHEVELDHGPLKDHRNRPQLPIPSPKQEYQRFVADL